ncbi:MAG: AbrB family transcriptional regulator [Sedimentitalea sp.]
MTDILFRTAVTVAIGALGAAVAFAISMPAAILIGPALAVTLAGLAGLRTAISDPLRDTCFVVLGLGLGAGFDPDASAAILRWPLAFLALLVLLALTMLACQKLLQSAFGFDPRSAVLASAPGHLSFVLSIAADSKMDAAPIAVVQSIRLLALTLSVPFVAMGFGVSIQSVLPPSDSVMGLIPLLALAIGGIALGLVFRKLRLPAPLLLGPMALSAATHASGLTPGSVPEWLLAPAFIGLGTMIGTRFSNMSLARFYASLGAGLAITGVAVVLSALAAIPVALLLGIPTPHVLAAFAPGGLETMIALGAAMGASPGFVAACHVMRLLLLTGLIPLALARAR